MVERVNLLADFYSDADDSDDSDYAPLRQALPVSGNLSNVNESIPPENGEEYIKRVVLEARRQPRIKVACNEVIELANTKALAKNPVYGNVSMPHTFDQTAIRNCLTDEKNSTTSAADPFVPDCEWKAAQLLEFDSVRKEVEEQREKFTSGDLYLPRVNFPTLNCGERWLRFCFGDSIISSPSTTLQATTDSSSDTDERLKPEVDGQITFTDIQREANQEELDGELASMDADVEARTTTQQTTSDTDTVTNEQTRTNGGGTQPLLSVVVQLKQAAITQLLELIVELLTDIQRCDSKSCGGVGVHSTSCSCAASAVLALDHDGGLNELFGRWLYALLAALETPLTPSACGTIRELARLCRARRLCIVQRLKDVIGEACSLADIEPRIRSLSLFVCLIAEYFRQRDLADPDRLT